MPVSGIVPTRRAMQRRIETGEPAPIAGEKPFKTAEEAWFWFMSWRLIVEDGGTPCLEGRGRPCMPLDMLACLRRLVKPGRLSRRQLQVLAGFGRRLQAPGRGPFAKLWDDGMAQLEEFFRAKGIVARKGAVGRETLA